MLNRIWSKLKSSSAVTPGFAKVFLKSFNLCIFSSLVILSFHHQIIFYNLPHIPVELQYRLIIPLINALLNGIVCVALYYYFAGRKFTSYSYRSENKPALFLTAFIAGFVSIYISFNAVTTVTGRCPWTTVGQQAFDALPGSKVTISNGVDSRTGTVTSVTPTEQSPAWIAFSMSVTED